MEHAYSVPWSRYGAKPWSLEPPEVDALMEKMRQNGVPLSKFAGIKPKYGIKTGLNDAFLIDTPTRMRLITTDPQSEELFKPYLCWFSANVKIGHSA